MIFESKYGMSHDIKTTSFDSMSKNNEVANIDGPVLETNSSEEIFKRLLSAVRNLGEEFDELSNE